MIFRSAFAAAADYLTALRYRLEFRIRGRGYRLPLDRATRLFATLFERRLRSRGAWFAFDVDTDTYRIANADGLESAISLSNAVREFAGDGDIYRAIRFADNMLLAVGYPKDWSTVRHQVLWDIQSSMLEGQSDLTYHLSDQTHQVPVIFDPETKHILFLDSHMLIEMNVREEMVEQAAYENLCAEAWNAVFIVREYAGVKYAIVTTHLPSKASLILAPNLREIVEPNLGWPLFAVIPRRDFMFLYDARCFDRGAEDIFKKVPGLGNIVLEEFELGAYPLSTEIFKITDQGVRAVAEYRRHPPDGVAKATAAD
jgi:hypothetical protein